MGIGCTLEISIWLSNKVFCNTHIGYTLNYLNSRCNTTKLLWVVIYVVCYGWFSPDLVVTNICRQRLIKVDRPLWQRSLANKNAVVCRQGAMRWRVIFLISSSILYNNTLSWGPLHASVGNSLRSTRTSSLLMDAVCLSHCYKVLSDPIW